MSDDERIKRVIADVADAMQSALLLATRLREGASTHVEDANALELLLGAWLRQSGARAFVEDAVALEAALTRAARVLETLRPEGGAR
jgi:hypothetical protein